MGGRRTQLDYQVRRRQSIQVLLERQIGLIWFARKKIEKCEKRLKNVGQRVLVFVGNMKLKSMEKVFS